MKKIFFLGLFFYSYFSYSCPGGGGEERDCITPEQTAGEESCSNSGSGGLKSCSVTMCRGTAIYNFTCSNGIIITMEGSNNVLSHLIFKKTK